MDYKRIDWHHVHRINYDGSCQTCGAYRCNDDDAKAARAAAQDKIDALHVAGDYAAARRLQRKLDSYNTFIFID